ncbi:cell division protein FtsK [Streptomyces phytohabitans]|uniref:cell division protein FtsK n=1 Tax=Streptomyces phytohabitans TaxID=1150371 RepID=UPI00345BA23D
MSAPLVPLAGNGPLATSTLETAELVSETGRQVVFGLAGVCLLALVVWALVWIVRYVRADPLTRVSIRQEVRIRQGWARLAKMTGLSVIDRTPTLLDSLSTPQGQEPKPREHVPKITTKSDQFGVIVHAKLLPNVGLEEFQKKARFLAAAWKCVRVSVLADGPGRVVIRAVRSDPLTVPATFKPSGKPPASVESWPLGVDEYAAEVAIRLANIPGVSVAGLPGYGKTMMINGLICQFAPSAAVQFAVADGKVSTADEGDYADVTDRLFAFVGDDLTEANALFKDMVALRRARTSLIKRVRRTANIWKVGVDKDWPLVVLIIDEAQTFFRDHKGNDRESKRLAALAADNARLVEDLVKKGRSAGMLVILATQKATGDAIPTFIRDVCPVGMSFAQKTADAAVAALGEDIRNWPEANPVSLQDPAYVGVASMVTQGREGFTRVRMPLVDEADAARIAQQTANLAVHPTELLRKLAARTGVSLDSVLDMGRDAA